MIFQAGDSEPGRDLGAEIGEGIFTHASSLEQAVAFRSELRARASAKGRNPDHVLVMPGVAVYVGDTDREARDIERDLQRADTNFAKALAEFGRPFGWYDFRAHDLDEPFPAVALRHAERSFFTQAQRITSLATDRNLTLRQTVELVSNPRPSPFTGSPSTVADELARWFEAGGVDGYNLHLGHPDQTRRFNEQVLPILRERGLARTGYAGTTLRENLGLPFIENRYASARREAELVPA